MNIRMEFAPALMTREVAAFYLSGSLRDVDELRAKGEITPVGKQKRVKYRKEDLDKYIAKLPEKASEEPQ